MMLTEIMKLECITIPLASDNKIKAIEELIDQLHNNNLLVDRNAALSAVMQRENSRSTGIGSGIAIPHGKHEKIENLVMALGIAKTPIEFGSIDNQPVSTIFLILAPANQSNEHVQTLAQISRLLINDDFKTKLENCVNAEEAYELFMKHENT